MPQLKVLKNIPYMLTGSIVSSYQGVLRSTHDIDLIISITKKDIPKIIKAFPKNYYYIDKRTINQAILNKDHFNIIDINEGDKIDFWMLSNSEFDKERFSRRQKVPLFNLEAYMSSPEDTILQKLYWLKLLGRSEKQYKDALGVFEIQYDNINISYLSLWSKKLKVEPLFRKLRQEAETSI